MLLDTLHSEPNATGIAERRTRTRVLVTPPIYANLAQVNGGLIYNMSEDGIAVTAAMVLPGEGSLTARILLPDSLGWFEANGQIAWRSESGKTAGIRFAGLPEEARQRIRNWLAEESSQGELQPASDGTAITPMVPLPNPMDPITAAVELIPEPNLSKNPTALIDQPGRIAAEAFPQLTLAVPDNLAAANGLPEIQERRDRPRSRIRPHNYIELGAANGGILLNISEGGFAITAALPLSNDHLAEIRIQFEGSWDAIEASGQIVWISESKKSAGIRFVNLTEEAQRIIGSRVSLGELWDELRNQSVKVADRPAMQAEEAEVPKLSTFTPEDARSGKQGDEAPAITAVSESLSPKASKESEFKPKSRPAFHPAISGAEAKKWGSLAAIVMLAAVTAASLRWVASPAVRNEGIGSIAKNKEGTNKPTLPEKSVPANNTPSIAALPAANSGSRAYVFDPVPADGHANSSEKQSAPVPPQVRGSERSAAGPAAKVAVRRADRPLLKGQSVKLSKPAVVQGPKVENVRSQAAQGLPAQSTENTNALMASPSASAPSGTGLAELKEKENPAPSSKQPVAPLAPTWSVSVSTDPYPSIRIPPEISSQKATQGRSLQIGHLVSRVEPVYPEDAKREGTEGTVKLHVVVGRDGAVQSVEPTGGPALLLKAATSAVREWRYAQTLLGGQPVETEQDVVVKFQLVSPSMSMN